MKKKTGKEPSDPKMLEELSKNLKPLVPVYKNLADEIGTSATMIKKYVEGISLPRCDIFLKVSKAVGKSMELLLTGKEHLQKQSVKEPDPFYHSKVTDILVDDIERLKKEKQALQEELDSCTKENERLKTQNEALKENPPGEEWDGKTERRKSQEI